MAKRRRSVSAPIPAARHNAVLEKALARVDRLEGRLARVIEPILDDAGKRAAERFGKYATNHLAAAAANADVGSTATMICVRPRPDESAAIADPDGDPPELLHVTLVYLGQIEDDETLAAAVEALRPVAAQFAPLEGVVGGYGLFAPAGVGVLLPDVRGLVELRVAVCEALLAAGIDYGREHGFEAHITVHSDPTTAEQDAALERAAGEPLHFDAICVVRGNSEEIEIPLVGVPALTADASPPDWTAPFPDELIDIETLVAAILAKTNPVRLAMIEQTMTPALEEAGLSWNVTNPLTAATLASTASQVKGIAETTQLNLMRIIRSAYQNGLSIPQTRDLIREGMATASRTRATMIARTELARAANGGSLAATQLVAEATGSQYEKRWETAPGAKYPRHEDYPDLDGQTAPLDGTFTVGMDQLQYPGDPDGDPGETINCRCAMTYHTPEGAATADAENPPTLDSADGVLGEMGITGDSEVLNSVNPTGSVFRDYAAERRATAALGPDMTTLDRTMGVSPDEQVSIYRGAPKYQPEIAAGDYVTTNKQLAKDYAGDGHVLEARVPASHILDSISDPLGEEYIYRPPLEPTAAADVRTVAEIIPGAPRVTLESVDRTLDSRISAYAQKHNMTEDEYRAAAIDSIRRGVANAEVGIRIAPDRLESFLNDGRYKTQFETGTSGGMLSTTMRADAEEQMFGYRLDLDPGLRPVYGYLVGSADETGPIGTGYGSVLLKLKSEVNARTTFSLSDSLGYGRAGGLAPPSLLDKYVLGAWPPGTDPVEANGILRKLTNGEYVETQIHGGVNTSDLEEVIFSAEKEQEAISSTEYRARIAEEAVGQGGGDATYAAELRARANATAARGAQLRAQLDSLGIPWRIVDSFADL